MIKICSKCNLSKELDSFRKDKRYSDGHNRSCQDCLAAEKRSRPKKKRKFSPEQNKKNYSKHREKRLQSFQQYYQINKEKIKEKQREYRQNNKEYIYLRNRKRRKQLIGGNVTQEEVNQLKQNNKCHYCGSTELLQIDHYVPLSKGGVHHISNLVIACRSCNLSKKDKMPEEWKKIKK